jgi:CubicO group peptidase (beta-lactamase class C family)
LVLERLTGKKMSDLMQEKVLGPLRLTNTTDPGPGTPDIPEPAPHAFTSERRSQLGIPAGTPFYEESTYWNPLLLRAALHRGEPAPYPTAALGPAAPTVAMTNDPARR